MSYTNVPLTGMSLGTSRPLINTNFSLLNTTIQKNHFSMNELNPGMHKFVQMPATGAIPPGMIANCLALYSKIVPLNSEEALFMTKGTSGQEIQMSCGNHSGITQLPFNASKGGTFLPGGLMMVWEYLLTPTGSTPVLYYAGGFSLAGAPISAYSIMVLPDFTAIPFGDQEDGAVGARNPTNVGFSILNTTNAPACWYLAIGSKT